MNEYIVVVQAVELVKADSADEAREIALKEAVKNADMDLEATSVLIMG